MTGPGMQAQDVFARLAAALATDGDLHALLVRLLEPIARLSHARAASVSVAEGGRLRQLGALELASLPAGNERVIVVALAHRGRSFGQYQLSIAADAVVGEETAAWCSERLGARLNEFYGQTEANLLIGNCSAWAAKPGSMGRAYG